MLFKLMAPFIMEGEALPTIFYLLERDFHGMRNFLLNASMDVVASLGLFQSARGQ